MPPEDNRNVPSWIEDKEKENFSNFLSIVGNSTNFNDRKWSDWAKIHDCENQIPSSNMSPFQ